MSAYNNKIDKWIVVFGSLSMMVMSIFDPSAGAAGWFLLSLVASEWK